MKLTCDDCGAAVPSENINIARAMAKCGRCGSVFGFADQVPNSVADQERPRVPMPRGIEVIDMGGDLSIHRRWFSPKFLFLVVFCLFWNGFLVVWYTLALSAEEAPWLMLVFPVLHVAAGVGLSYYTLCGFVNRTVIRVGQGKLRIRHGPLPWPGNREVETSRLEQLYCTEEVHRSKNGTSTTYKLRANTRVGEALELLTVDERAQALFLEQRLETALGIRDRPVKGEVER